MSGSSEEDYLTVKDSKAWLEQELRDLARAHRLRVEEATFLTTEYEAGRLSAREAEEHMAEYIDKWGDSPVPGVATTDNMTDREVFQKMDDHRTKRRADAMRRREARDRQGKDRER